MKKPGRRKKWRDRVIRCPHQHRYTAFDCRVQRYFVEGMLDALRDHGYGNFTARVETLIPEGAKSCHFVVEKLEGETGKNPWHEYSDKLGDKFSKFFLFTNRARFAMLFIQVGG
ncbi:MAG: hypothetical protein JRI51_01515 [Deltaproteobacteria bacterium]|nr:hypothetical protein [Deltaproteobacteria bacterium]